MGQDNPLDVSCNLYQEALNWYWGLEGHPVGDAEAVQAFETAAELGHPGAQLQMGVFYKLGGLKGKDSEKAADLFEKVRDKKEWFINRAEQGEALAQWQLSRLVAHGVVTGKSDAMDWCKAAAEQGYALAQFDLSQCYYTGEGVPQDSTLAILWCRRAADQKLVEAVFWLGHILGGPGVPHKCDSAGAAWLRQAAALGHCAAQRLLGFHYSATREQPACKWLKNSRDNGSLPAAQLLFHVNHSRTARAQAKAQAGAITASPTG
eukprot:TRINITY_DN18229_c0_g2_i2.p1 TRINITY_DN18229_c0_g2~~TRINITY_DN18229_c0_g2_i2.p1  ORF type:complete len:263 (+),score=45.30 TRINITY_DN18229_c0_g2_i2:40-828(+)